MQQERRKVKGYKFLCLFKTISNRAYRIALCSVSALLVARMSTTNIYSIKRHFLSSGKRSPIR